MSVVEGSIPEQRHANGIAFPLVLVPADHSNNSAAVLNDWISKSVCFNVLHSFVIGTKSIWIH